LFNYRNISFILLTVLLILSVLFLHLNAVNPAYVFTLILLLPLIMAALCIKYRRYLKKIEVRKDEAQENINTLSSEIQTKREYLRYIPEHAQRLNFFKRLIEELIKFQSIEDIFGFLGKEIEDIFKGLDVSLLYMVEQDKLKLVSSYKRKFSYSVRHKEGDTFDYWVLKHNQDLLIEDITQDFRFDLEKIVSLKERVINSLIISPMSLGEKRIGILRIESKERKKFNFEDLRILSVIADLASAVIDRARIFKRVQELAIRDGMTGLYLRNYFNERLKEEMNRALRNRSPIGILLADVDFFKKLNDECGHIVGDLVLKRLSESLRDVIGDAGNIICRFGGEEFIAFLVSSSKKQTREVAEALRKKIETTPLGFRRKKINFTVSIGVACFPEDAKFLEDLIKKADDALYEAKRKGRNRVCLAG